MASNTTKKSKSSGMRILWLPGRKSHSKDQISSTKTQRKAEVSELNDLPSSLSLTTCSLTERDSSIDGSLTKLSETATLQVTSVTTYSPNLRPTASLPEIAPTRAMTLPTVITTAEIQDIPNFISPDDLPKVPAAAIETDVVLNSSAETSMAQEAQDSAHSQESAPQKNKNRNHNNNQDINSIESISTDFDWIDEMVHQRNCNEMMHKNKRNKASTKGLESSLQPEADEIIDQQMYSYNNNDLAKHNSSKGSDGDDDLVVKCLYYTLMCCDCRIS
ncbi:uncharacterized protein [Drosophila kikkawai]|uniref:Uncharacterized protein isoform X1 n=1 Tax=Drosophila kikkawai TaxID=30033 RepID=A0ABM4GGD2_DROKI|nr:uncharacterized protein LOC108075135 isoform X1 [Drosophila kikkawai]